MTERPSQLAAAPDTSPTRRTVEVMPAVLWLAAAALILVTAVAAYKIGYDAALGDLRRAFTGTP